MGLATVAGGSAFRLPIPVSRCRHEGLEVTMAEGDAVDGAARGDTGRPRDGHGGLGRLYASGSGSGGSARGGPSPWVGPERSSAGSTVIITWPVVDVVAGVPVSGYTVARVNAIHGRPGRGGRRVQRGGHHNGMQRGQRPARFVGLLRHPGRRQLDGRGESPDRPSPSSVETRRSAAISHEWPSGCRPPDEHAYV